MELNLIIQEAWMGKDYFLTTLMPQEHVAAGKVLRFNFAIELKKF